MTLDKDNNKQYINLACGDVYIKDDAKWKNFDFIGGNNIIKVNLLSLLPINNSQADLVYCSHFIEHIPKRDVASFLKECFRILKKNGVLRLVLPDFRIMAQEYLFQRENKNNQKAVFMITSIIDQFIRTTPGGDLQRTIDKIEASKNEDLINFIYERTGYKNNQKKFEKKNLLSIFLIFHKLKSYLYKRYCKIVVSLLPRAFKNQNVSFAEIGEKHAWLYDEFSLEELLNTVGFKNIKVMTCNTSLFSDFPFKELDVNSDGVPRKGKDSIYIEALK